MEHDTGSGGTSKFEPAIFEVLKQAVDRELFKPPVFEAVGAGVKHVFAVFIQKVSGF